MRGCVKAMLAVVALGAIATPALAQGRGGFGMGGNMGIPGLIANPGVQAELKLDDAQKEKATAFAEELREKQREMYTSTEGLDGEERMKKLQELGRASSVERMKTLGTFLKPEQTKRFEQIVFQQRGADALADPVMAKKLAITVEQAEKVKALIGEQRAQMMEARDSSNGDRGAIMRKDLAIRKETTAKVMALMTDAQKATWKEMTGEPYEVAYGPRPGR